MAGQRHTLIVPGSVLLALMTAPGVRAQAGPGSVPQDSAAVPPAGLDLYMPAPPGGNRPEVVALGRRLFFDARLSRDSSVTCSTCHRPDRAFADGMRVAVGVDGRTGRRNVPALLNRGWARSFFWDGRAPSLEALVVKPIRSPAEMDLGLDAAVRRVADDDAYDRAFRAAFGRGPSAEALARALAAYVRSIRAGDSPFDRFATGRADALSAVEREGLDLFRGRARCDRCHTGPLLSDEAFHNTGVAWRDGEPRDSGRAGVTRQPQDVGAFRTPTLREVARTAPYMHDGSLATLEDVVEFYDRGGHANPYLDPLIRPLDLTAAEKHALVAFLRALTGRIREGN